MRLINIILIITKWFDYNLAESCVLSFFEIANIWHIYSIGICKNIDIYTLTLIVFIENNLVEAKI